jgi:DHA1 family bicyclomycin/chloramphenicol resistance-like MFS transporter
LYIFILGGLTALGPLTMDLYLAAFPAIARDFAASPASVQLTFSATAFGLGLGQIVIGPWSDRVGRRLPVLLATGIHILACVVIAVAPTIQVFTVLRAAQGVGAAASAVVALAMVRDMFGGKPMVAMLARLSLVGGMTAIAAPAIGAQLLRVVDWRAVFWFLAGYGLLMLVLAVAFCRETLPVERRHSAQKGSLRRQLRVLVTDRVFVGAVLIGGASQSALFTYVSASSFLLQGEYGLSPQTYGLLFGVNAVGLFAGIQVSARVMRRVDPQWILAWTTPLVLVSALFLAAPIPGGVYVPIVCFFVLVTTFGFMSPCIQVLALANHARAAGTAASVSGFTTTILAGLVSAVPGILGLSTLTVALVIGVAGAAAVTALWLVVRPRQVPALAD